MLTKDFNIGKLNIKITLDLHEFAFPIAIQNYVGNYKQQNFVIQIACIFISFTW